MNNSLILPKSFYLRENVTDIARDLIGKSLVTVIGGAVRKGMIVETEAYSQNDDRACHAYNGKRTKRTETMFLEGGHAYVYLCYGIHHLFNVVTNKRGIADAVLIRGVEPIEGSFNHGNGPGKLTREMGITKNLDKHLLNRDPIWIERFRDVDSSEIVESTRIGVDYAGDDALKPWRFYLAQNAHVSKLK